MKTCLLIAGLMLALAQTAVAKDEFASAKEAEVLVAKAVAALKTGKQKVYEEIINKDAKWVDRDLYLTICDFNAKVLAHGANSKMVGKDLIGFKDSDGKPFYKERIDLAKSKGKFWQDYKFTDPVTKRIMPKQMYCESLDDTVVCAGIYKR